MSPDPTQDQPRPASPAPSLAVILLHWKNTTALWHQIERLLDWSHPPDIWVVENESIPHTPVQTPHLYQVKPTGNLGYAGGINAAWRAMPSGRYAAILLMNTDLEVEERDIDRLWQGLHEANAAIIGPLLVEPGPRGPLTYAGGRDPVRWVHTRLLDQAKGAIGWPRVDYVPGTVCLIRSDVMRTLDGLEESFFFSGEIADFGLRAGQLGFRCTVHRDVVVHHHTDAGDAPRATLYLYYSLRNRFLLIQRHRPQQAFFWKCLWTGRGLAMLVLRLVRGQGSAARAIGLAVRDGWMNTFGPTTHAFPT